MARRRFGSSNQKTHTVTVWESEDTTIEIREGELIDRLTRKMAVAGVFSVLP